FEHRNQYAYRHQEQHIRPGEDAQHQQSVVSDPAPRPLRRVAAEQHDRNQRHPPLGVGLSQENRVAERQEHGGERQKQLRLRRELQPREYLEPEDEVDRQAAVDEDRRNVGVGHAERQRQIREQPGKEVEVAVGRVEQASPALVIRVGEKEAAVLSVELRQRKDVGLLEVERDNAENGGARQQELGLPVGHGGR